MLRRTHTLHQLSRKCCLTDIRARAAHTQCQARPITTHCLARLSTSNDRRIQPDSSALSHRPARPLRGWPTLPASLAELNGSQRTFVNTSSPAQVEGRASQATSDNIHTPGSSPSSSSWAELRGEHDAPARTEDEPFAGIFQVHIGHEPEVGRFGRERRAERFKRKSFKAERLDLRDQQQQQRQAIWEDKEKPLMDDEIGRITSSEKGDKEKIDHVYRILGRESRKGRPLNASYLVEVLLKTLGEPPNLKLYSALILANIGLEGTAADVGALLQELEADGFTPDSVLYHNALKALAVHPDPLLRAEILENMRKRWFDLTDIGWHDVVAGYVRENQLELAFEQLDQMRASKVKVQGWLYDMIMFTLCDAAELDEALRILKQRVDTDELSISVGVWYYVFDTACTLLHHESLDFVWRNRIETLHLNPSQGQCLAVLCSASRSGDVSLCTDVFRVLSDRNFHFASTHYELLLSAYLSISDLKTALTICCIMSGAGMTLSASSLSPILQHLRLDASHPLTALNLLKEMVAGEGRQIPTPVINTLLESAAHHRSLPHALAIYRSLHKLSPEGPDVQTFNALFRACREAAETQFNLLDMPAALEVKETAMFLASEMKYLKVAPNSMTYDRLILCCLSQEDPSDAWRYYGEMRESEFWPRLGTWYAMVQRLKKQADEEGREGIMGGEEGDGTAPLERAWALVGTMREKGLLTGKLEGILTGLSEDERDRRVRPMSKSVETEKNHIQQ